MHIQAGNFLTVQVLWKPYHDSVCNLHTLNWYKCISTEDGLSYEESKHSKIHQYFPSTVYEAGQYVNTEY